MTLWDWSRLLGREAAVLVRAAFGVARSMLGMLGEPDKCSPFLPLFARRTVVVLLRSLLAEVVEKTAFF